MNTQGMTYIRSKMINGCGPYYYEVRSVRHGKTVKQEFVRYLGKNPGVITTNQPTNQVFTPTEERERPKGYLEVEGAGEREETRGWSRLRTERARKISETVGCNRLQADALAKHVYRLGMNPDTYPWDEVQGADLSYEERLDKISSRSDMEFRTTKELETAEWDYRLEPYMDKLSVEREDWRDLSHKQQVKIAKAEYIRDEREGTVLPNQTASVGLGHRAWHEEMEY